MRSRTYLWLTTTLTGGGTAFAGYLSSVRLESGVCAFNEPCPFFLGYPACYTGFALFLAMFLPSAVAQMAKVEKARPIVLVNMVLSTLGVLFASRLAIMELANPLVPSYGMGLPTCAYGLVVFLAVLIASTIALLRRPGDRTGRSGAFRVRPIHA